MDKEYLDRYKAVMSRISAGELLALPEGIKDLLKSTTDLRTKVVILEEIAGELERRKHGQ